MGDIDLILLVFAGAAAEFALNRAVDWLFFTGRLPSDPLGRLFLTATYAQRIALADFHTAERTLAGIRAAHASVERERDAHIPNWAHRDVLYLLVDYLERAFQTLHRPLSTAEQGELWEVFRRVGVGLGIPELPPTHADWRADQERHLKRDLIFSEHTTALYTAYRRHLGPWQYLTTATNSDPASSGARPPTARSPQTSMGTAAAVAVPHVRKPGVALRNPAGARPTRAFKYLPVKL